MTGKYLYIISIYYYFSFIFFSSVGVGRGVEVYESNLLPGFSTMTNIIPVISALVDLVDLRTDQPDVCSRTWEE